MRKLERSGDSLELLLDTVCSMFGAILLIAILVALMAQTTKVESASEQAGSEMIKRKIATAEEDLAQIRRLAAQLTPPPENETATLNAEKQAIERALATARAQREKISAQFDDQVARQSVDYSTEWKKMTAELHVLERRQDEVANAIKTQEQNSARLEGRAAEINKLIQQAKDARIATLRFPKERARTKKALPIICQFGKLYPLYDAEGARNESTIAWSSRGGGSEISRPVEALGWTTVGNQPAIEHLLSALPKKEIYLAFYVYPDSFEVFHTVREEATAAQWDFGVELEPAGVTLSWGKDGTTPPPL